MTELLSYSPSTGEVIWQGQCADARAVDAAVQAAWRAYPAWSHTPLEQRIAVLERYAQLLGEHRERIATLIAQENGKVWREANAEAGALISKVSISIEAYQRTGASQADMGGGVRRALSHRALGVMAVFGPYNFPMHLPNGHSVPALLAGNTVVLKPSEETPACGALLVELLMQAGLPEGAVSVVQGGRDVGVALVEHPHVSGVLFTGSYATGQAIHRALAGRPEVMLALEMGGNNPLIVHDVADVQAAATLVIDSAFASTGQRCTCARRLIVQRGAQGDALIEAVADMAARITTGAPFDTPEPYMGALINQVQAKAVLHQQAALLDAGADALCLAQRQSESLPFISAGVLDVSAVAERGDEEIFGPLLQVIRVSDMEEALHVANDTKYGLSAGVITDDMALWEQLYPRLRAGIINVNRPLTGAASASPFGGPGCSGNFRPSAYYAADYCAYPVASLLSDEVQAVALTGVA